MCWEKTICFNGVLEVCVLNLNSTLEGVQGLKDLFELDTACSSKTQTRQKCWSGKNEYYSYFEYLSKVLGSTPACESLNAGFSWGRDGRDDLGSRRTSLFSLTQASSTASGRRGPSQFQLNPHKKFCFRDRFIARFLRQKTPTLHGDRAVTAWGASDAAL